MDAEEEAALVGRIRAGDDDAFTALVAATHRDLRCFVAAHAWSVETVDEVVQDAYVVLFRRIADLEPGCPVLAWLKGVARRRLLSALRERISRRRMQPGSLVDMIARRCEAGLDDDGAEPTAAMLRDCLGRLAEDARGLVEMHYRTGRTVAEIAAHLGAAPGTVAMRLHRIRGELRECLRRKGVTHA